MANETKFLSSLQFPGSSEYVIDAKYVGGRPAEEFISAVNSAMIFKGTLGAVAGDNATVLALPVDDSVRVGDTYKYIGSVEPKDYSGLTLYKGDLVIYAEVPNEGKRWVRVPAGSESEISQLVAGNYIEFFGKDGTKVTKLESNGTIGLNLEGLETTLKTDLDHKHNVGFSGAHKHEFTGTKVDLSTRFTPEGTIKINGKDTEDITPAGSVTIDNATVTGSIANTYSYTDTDVVLSDAVKGVTVDSHGVIPFLTDVAVAYTGTSETISSAGTATGNVTIAVANNRVNERYAEYTPGGTVTGGVFTGSEHDELNVTGALSSVTVADHKVEHVKNVTASVSTTTKTVNIGTIKPEGTVTVDEATSTVKTATSEFTGEIAAVTVAGTATISSSDKFIKTVAMNIKDEHKEEVVKSINYAETPTTVVAGITETSYDTTSQKVVFGYTPATVVSTANVTFTPTTVLKNADITTTDSIVTVSGNVSLEGSTTDKVAGSIVTTVVMNPHTHEASFEGKNSENLSVDVIDEITVTPTVVREEVTIEHDVTTSTAGVKTDKFTPAGTNSAYTFSGNTVYIGGAFSDGAANVSATYTPKATLTVTPTVNTKEYTHKVNLEKSLTVTYKKLTGVTSTFTGDPHKHTATFTGTAKSISASFDGTSGNVLISDYTPAGTISDTTLTFSGETSNSISWGGATIS